jgi:hypothetical protein
MFAAVALSLPTRKMREKNRSTAGKAIVIILLDPIEAVWQGISGIIDGNIKPLS